MKVVILNSGSFYLNQTADIVSNHVDTVLIQNYTPSIMMTKLLTLFDSVFGTRFRRIKVRQCHSSSLELHGLFFNDILYLLGKAAIKMGFNKDRIETIVAKQFGMQASKYISNANILQLRTGYGQGGAIEKARSRGMKIIADHSIACTEEIAEILDGEYERYGIKFGIGPKFKFWQLVIKDCKEADIILVNSDYVKKTFVKYGYNPKRIVVNYLGVRNDWFSIKQDYSLSDGCLKLLFIGEFGIRKGAEYLIKASQILNRKDINYKIIVIGKQVEICDLINSSDMSHFEFVGTVLYDNLKTYYSQCDAYLFPSLCEGSTRAGMEAMAAGLPVILTENCGCPVNDGINGLIVPIKDESAIANAVERLYHSEDLRERLGKAAAKTIAQSYTWDHYKNNLLSLYENMTSE